MIEQSSVSTGNTPVQVDSKPVKQTQISDISRTEILQPEQVVAQVKESAQIDIRHNKIQETVASLNAFVHADDAQIRMLFTLPLGKFTR